MTASPTSRSHARAIALRVATGLSILAAAGLAQAHVKWFAPFVVGAPTVPLSEVLANRWLWTALVMVAVAIAATTWIERTAAGQALWRGLDWATSPVRKRLDDFMQVTIGAFFVALFAVGNLYLTPELQTDKEWISWAQLAIAAGVFSRRTMPLSALGIIVVWLLALREYDFFHLLDYLPLGVAVAGYLVLAASGKPAWHARRFEFLRWGVAIALMWSSLEKFYYPSWFHPLVEEKPFLTFGLPRDVFIPMAGVAEFAMGFGLVWTPLVRRLSAAALLVIFTAAVYPFGRIDLVGHALIMGALIVILSDDSRVHRTAPRRTPFMVAGPARLAGFLVVLGLSYHTIVAVLYGPEQDPATPHAGAPEHAYHPPQNAMRQDDVRSRGLSPAAAAGTGAAAMAAANDHAGHGGTDGHGPPAGADTAAARAYQDANARMHAAMSAPLTGNADVDFAQGMIAHHEGAIEMADLLLAHGRDARLRRFAENVKRDQSAEVAELRAWLKQQGGGSTTGR